MTVFSNLMEMLSKGKCEFEKTQQVVLCGATSIPRDFSHAARLSRASEVSSSGFSELVNLVYSRRSSAYMTAFMFRGKIQFQISQMQTEQKR